MSVTDGYKCSRRAFAQGSLGLGVALATGLGASECLAAAASAPSAHQPRQFTAQEMATVQAIMARLIPGDASHGGALEACAHVYLDQALGAHLARYVDTYRHGLAQLEQLAAEAGPVGFAALDSLQMDSLLTRMEKGELAQGRFADGGVAFFNLLRRHTLEGFLSDPLYGGNKDFIGWQAIGYSGVQLTYPAATQQLNGRDERAPRSVASFGGTGLP